MWILLDCKAVWSSSFVYNFFVFFDVAFSFCRKQQLHVSLRRRRKTRISSSSGDSLCAYDVDSSRMFNCDTFFFLTNQEIIKPALSVHRLRRIISLNLTNYLLFHAEKIFVNLCQGEWASDWAATRKKTDFWWKKYCNFSDAENSFIKC